MSVQNLENALVNVSLPEKEARLFSLKLLIESLTGPEKFAMKLGFASLI